MEPQEIPTTIALPTMEGGTICVPIFEWVRNKFRLQGDMPLTCIYWWMMQHKKVRALRLSSLKDLIAQSPEDHEANLALAVVENEIFSDVSLDADLPPPQREHVQALITPHAPPAPAFAGALAASF